MCKTGGMVALCLAAVMGVVFASPTQACVGARALSMGGAFTGLADDLSATYWNPAALAELPQDESQVTLMYTANNRDRINYQQYLAYGKRQDDRSGLGISYIRYKLFLSSELRSDQNWYWLSYGVTVSPKTSVGANVRLITDSVNRSGLTADTDLAVDLAVYHHASDNVTVGLLVQNANEPKTTVKAGDTTLGTPKWVRNWRPGVAVRVPEQNVIVSAELYDATDEFDRALRLGVEKRFPKSDAWGHMTGEGYALRAGWYASADSLTLGAGVWRDTSSADIALLTGDMDDTWLLSGTTSF